MKPCHPIDVPMDVDEPGQNGNGSSRKRESIVTEVGDGVQRLKSMTYYLNGSVW
jgi:hypothetical protein